MHRSSDVPTIQLRLVIKFNDARSIQSEICNQSDENKRDRNGARLHKKCASVLTPTIINIINLSLTSGQFRPIKKYVISPTSQETYSRPSLYEIHVPVVSLNVNELTISYR